jgi:hypothetical protein
MAKPGPKRHERPIEESLLPGSPLPLRAGDSYVQRYYEEEFTADDTLADERRTSEDPGARTEYLSREQLHLRQSREVVNINGVPDGRLMQGLYRRAYNPLAGNRPNVARRGDE